MRRLYQKIYLVFLASLLTVVLIIGLFWRLGQPESPYSHAFEVAGELAMSALPPADAPRRLQEQAVEHLAQRLHADLGLFGADRLPIAASGTAAVEPRLGPRHGPAGMELSPAGWALDRGTRAGARS
jgi:hypothetical protein